MEEVLLLIDFNKSKFKLLKQIFDLENNNQTNTDEYIELLNYYKLVCNVYNKRLNNISPTQKYNLYEKILFINPDIYKGVTFEKLLEFDQQHIILNRIKLDFVESDILKVYRPKLTKNIIQQLIEKNEAEETQEESTLNHLMCDDFINTLYNIIDKKSKIETNKIYLNQLTNLKCNLLLLSSSLEERILMTNFSLPNALKLNSRLIIETNGISLKEYNEILDSFIIQTIENIIIKTLSKNKRNFYLDTIIIETLATLLYDKEYIDVINIETESNLNDLIESNIIREKIKILLKILTDSKTNTLNNDKTRRYIKI